METRTIFRYPLFDGIPKFDNKGTICNARSLCHTSQRGIRSGTVPAPLIIGLGAACQICMEDMEFDHAHVEALSDRLYNKIIGSLDGVIRNGHDVHTYPGVYLLIPDISRDDFKKPLCPHPNQIMKK